MMWRNVLVGTLLLCCSVPQLSAQIPDSRGREFWLTFLPNYHNNRQNPDPRLRYGDSLYLFLVADQPCRGFIEWWDAQGQRNEERFVIADPQQPYVFARSWWGIELMGYNDSGTLLLSGSTEGGQGEKPVRQSLHIVVEEGGEVTVYAFQQAVFSSDAFLVLPVDVLGTEYLVMSYPSDGAASGAAITGSSTPSQFAIVAVEDQTQVLIRPTAPTYWNGLNEQRIVLNRGEVYLVQARITAGNLNPDLTGTEILSSKPIAVFAGHQRATVPVYISTLTSRDMLVEQLPPVSTWGSSALVVHFPVPSTGMAPEGTHLYRVLAARDNTTVFANGQQVAVLNRGEFYEAPLTQPVEVQATGPILVATFHKTTNAGQTERIGDPFMMLIPPAQQFMPRYRFINAQKYSYSTVTDTYEAVYRDQYATAVLPSGAELFLDGQLVPQTLYQPIGASGYVYVWLPTSDGVHDIEARFPDGSPARMGLYVYGYGPADSYGYVGGASFRPLDIAPPRLVAEQQCLGVVGVVYDTAQTDSRLQAVEVAQAENVAVTIEPFPIPADSVRFRATLIDPAADGFFQLRARDSAGYERLWDFAIPGFTLQVTPPTVQLALFADGSAHCRDFTITNSGSFPKRLTQVRFSGTLPPQATVTLLPPDSLLRPGDSRTVRVCFAADRKGEFRAQLLLADSCFARDSAALLVVSIGADEHPPVAQRSRDSCGWSDILFVADTGAFASGIAELEVLEQVNCTVELLQQDVLNATVRVRVLNPYEDAWYGLRLRDRSGNEQLIRDTLPGFTLSVVEPRGGVVRVPPVYFGTLHCDTVWLFNYGLFPLRLEQLPLRVQTAFSVPPGQLPLLIPPGERRGLLVCFAPLQPQVGQYVDTLDIGTPCVALQVVVQGELVAQDYYGQDRCGMRIRGSQLVRRTFLDPPAPQPSAAELSIRFGLTEAAVAELQLVDVQGRQVRRFFTEALPAGVYTLVVSVAELPSGMYWLQFRTPTALHSQPVLILR
jgi:hypothetical protein